MVLSFIIEGQEESSLKDDMQEAKSVDCSIGPDAECGGKI